MKEVDVSSLEHTSWRCQYHVVFAPKYENAINKSNKGKSLVTLIFLSQSEVKKP